MIDTDFEQKRTLKSIEMLKKFAVTWGQRAQVKKERLEKEDFFDLSKDDFTEALLPFADHEVYLNNPPEIKKKILTCAWIAYNEKTVALETMIINPLCVDIINNNFLGLENSPIKTILSQVMIDESYHVLMVVNSSKIAMERRNLNFGLTTPNFVKKMQIEQSRYSEYKKKLIIQFIMAMVAEIFTSPTMYALCNDDKIQPLHQQTVKAHLADELAHGNIFRNLAAAFYSSLNVKEKSFFVENLFKPSQWLADIELNNWRVMLDAMQIEDYSTLIDDMNELNLKRSQNVNVDNIISLAEDIGIDRVSI